MLGRQLPLRLLQLLLAAVLALAPSVHAEDYPGKPIKLVVPYPPGGGTDIVARIIAEKLQAKWGQPVIVENRAGASGNIGAEGVFRSQPDGYTLLLAVPGPLVIHKSLYPKLAYDSDAFVPISVIATIPLVLLVHPKVTAESVQQLIAFAKANPGRLNYASQGVGSPAYLGAELFKLMADVKITEVPYKGTGPALADLLAGHVDMMFGELASAGQHLRGGKLRALAVAGDKAHPMLPKIPVISEVLPGFDAAVFYGVVAPPGTPPVIANKLSGAIAEAIRQPDVAQRLTDLSMVTTGGSTPAEMGVFMRQERERWGKVIRAIGATAE